MYAAKVYILESSPFIGHSALEELPPSELRLLIDKSMERGWVCSFVDGAGVEPGCQAFNQDVDEVGAGIEAFACDSKGGEEAVLPGFSIGMRAAQ